MGAVSVAPDGELGLFGQRRRFRPLPACCDKLFDRARIKPNMQPARTSDKDGAREFALASPCLHRCGAIAEPPANFVSHH
jgi:hypothetical protein